METNRHFHFIVPVWGESYSTLFADVCLPLLMTRGNLGAVAEEKNHLFVIVTTFRDGTFFSSHPSLIRLREFVEVKFELMDGLTDTRMSHTAMSDCYAKAMKSTRVVPGLTYFVFLTPDSFWSENTFRRRKALADEGYGVAMAMGLRTNLETLVPILRDLIAEKQENPAISIEQLVTLALAHLHNMSKAHDWLSGDRFLNAWPSHLYWWGGRDRLVARCFHLHPLMVQSKRGVTKIGDTIDGQFLDNLNYPIEKYYISRSNEDFLGIELSKAERTWGQPLSKPSVRLARLFGLWHANPRHWRFFATHIEYRGANYQEHVLDASTNALAEEVVKRVCHFRFISVALATLRIKLVLFRALIRSRRAKQACRNCLRATRIIISKLGRRRSTGNRRRVG